MIDWLDSSGTWQRITSCQAPSWRIQEWSVNNTVLKHICTQPPSTHLSSVSFLWASLINWDALREPGWMDFVLRWPVFFTFGCVHTWTACEQRSYNVQYVLWNLASPYFFRSLISRWLFVNFDPNVQMVRAQPVSAGAAGFKYSIWTRSRLFSLYFSPRFF